MKLVPIIFFLQLLCFSFNSTAQGYDYQVCLDLEAKFAKYPLQEISRSTLEEIKNKKPQLIVLGEYHYDHLFWKMSHVYDFLKKHVNNDIDCMFSEISQDTTDTEIEDVIDGIMNDIFYTRRRLGFGPLYQHIYDRGDDLVLVDAPRGQIEYRQEDDKSTWLTRRDTFMISRIKKSFEANQCTGGIYNVGNQHIQNRLIIGIDASGNPVLLPYLSFGHRIKKTKVDSIVIDKGVNRDLRNCYWSEGVHSFIAPADSPVVREIFPNIKENESSGDYVLFLNEIETLNVFLN